VNNVEIPTGKFAMGDTTLFFPGSCPKYTPGLKGLGGIGSVVLEWENTIQGPWISTGSEVPGAGALNATLYQSFENLELRARGGVSKYGGFRSRFGLMQSLTDVMTRGLIYTDQPWDAGVGFDFRLSSVASSNHQHLRLTRCYSNYNCIGYWFGEATWSVTAVDVHANGCTVAPAMYEQAAVVSWWGGNTQCGASAPHLPYWFAGTQPAVHCSGANYTTGLPSGAGASMGAASGQFTVVTGLFNMLGYLSMHDTTHKGMWLEVRLTSGAHANEEVYSGLYRIHEVLGDDSCIIRKGSNHAPIVGGLTYQVRGSGGGVNITVNGVYQEGGAYALASLGPDIITSSRFTIQGCEGNNAETLFEATGTSGTLRALNTFIPGGKSGVLRRCYSSFLTDSRVADVDMDSASRPGVQCMNAEPGDNRQSRVWDAGPRLTRYNSALKERGFTFICDARKPGSIVRSGDNVSSWVDFVGSIAGARVNAAVSPQYVANDAALGCAAIRFTGGTAANLVGAMEWNLASKFTAGKYYDPTLIVIGRLPDTTPSTTNRMCRFTSGFTFSLETRWNDNALITPSSCASVYSTVAGALYTTSLFPSDTSPHVIVSTSHCGGRAAAGGGSDVVDFAVAGASYGAGSFGFVGGAAANIEVGKFVNTGTVGDLFVSHIAFAPFGITDDERAAFVDMARNEFSIPE
jgi:hypothetical protein